MPAPVPQDRHRLENNLKPSAPPMTKPAIDKPTLDQLYDRYNRRSYVHPDPLEFLYRYTDPADRELVGLLASSLAYGKVAQILTSVQTLLDEMPEPARFAANATRSQMKRAFSGFQHRWTRSEDVVGLLAGAGRVIRRHGSLRAGFVGHLRADDPHVLPALDALVADLWTEGGALLALPGKGSACNSEAGIETKAVNEITHHRR